MALNDQLITIADVRGFKGVSVNIDTTDFSAYLKRVQNTGLRELLGDALWYDLFINKTETKYANLIHGCSWTYNSQTVYYNGLKPFLSYSWLILYGLEGNVQHTNAGNYTFDPETGLPLKTIDRNQSVSSYRTEQSIERNNILLFLNNNTATYTLWQSKSRENPTRNIIDFI